MRRMSPLTSGSRGGRPGLPGSPVGPLASYELPVPAQQRLRRDEKRCPPVPGQDPAGGGEQEAVECGESGTASLATQYTELLPQYQDLQVLGTVSSAWEHQHAGERTDDQREQGTASADGTKSLLTVRTRFPRPTGFRWARRPASQVRTLAGSEERGQYDGTGARPPGRREQLAYGLVPVNVRTHGASRTPSMLSR
jgi:hypothetical protein